MLGVKLLCVGKMKERFYADALAEYAKRLGRYCAFQVEELPESGNLAQEAALLERKIPNGAYRVAMCVEGRQLSSPALARQIETLAASGCSRLCFLIGGSCGLDASLKASAGLRLSMSEMTFPHHLARVMLAEQLYRAFTIINGEKYHK